jgi:hypothetical protein
MASKNSVSIQTRNSFAFASTSASSHGCQMVCFQTKNPNLGKFWRVLEWKILVSFMTIWSVLRPLEILNGNLVYFVVIWYIFPRFGDLATLLPAVARNHRKVIQLAR